MKILITGAGGFIGSHLTEYLVQNGYSVRAFVRYNSANKYGWLEKSEYKTDIEIFTGDIRDFDSVYNAVKGCEAVFHLAALIGIPYSYYTPLGYLKTNLIGTYNILESVKNLRIDNILITSTSEVYGTAQYVPIDEKHPLVAQSPYSASKIAADMLSLSYFYSYGLPVKIVRPFNTYGPRQSSRAIIPTIITQLLSDKKDLLLGNLFPTRDLTFVEDTVKAYLKILKTDDFIGEVVNIGMNKEISVKELVIKISQIIGKNVNIITDNNRIRPIKSEVKRLLCDNSKLISKTFWKPDFSIETGLEKTVEWIKDNLDFYKTDIYNV